MPNPGASQPGTYAPLRQVALLRLYFLLGLVAVCVSLQSRSGFRVDATIVYVYVTLAVAYIASAALYVWLRNVGAVTGAVIALPVAVDLAVVTALTSASGGVDSIFGVLFMVVILEGAALGGMRGSLITATATSAAYLVVAVLDHLGAFAQAQYLRVGTAEPLDADLWAFAALRILAFYLVGVLSGFLARRIGHLERQQANLLENFATGYLAVDRQGRLTFLNSAGRRILGGGATPELGAPLGAMLRMEPNGGNPLDLSLRLRKEFYEAPCTHWRTNGEAVPLNVTTTFIRSRGHEIGGVMAHFSDQTLVQELEDTVRQQDRLALAGELSASLAHEVRNPVAAIRSAAQELRQDEEPGPADLPGRLLNIIVRESDQLNRVVTHFLEYARVNAQDQHGVNLRELVEEVLAAVQREPERLAGITVETHWPATGLDVKADAGLLKEASLNLIHNALDAMPDGGTLRLSAQPAPRTGHVELTVEDTGVGIPEDDLPRIFQPFFTMKRTGTGLGLAIVHRIVQAHAGEIQVQSQPGAGTRMRVRLPIAE